MRSRWFTAITVLVCVHGCGAGPPAYTSDQDDADVYADVALRTREDLNVSGRMYTHPYLAVAVDGGGALRADMTTFEYEPSSALGLLQQQDTSLVLCQFDAQGMCAENYVVFSQITRTSERDAVVVVQSVRGSGKVRALMVKLRFGPAGWRVSDSEPVT